ncbi:MAG: insulinase family protein [Acidobacteria bacterium]|nr:MAG: insulinase family protein [Acidobacteriota bacterium]
MIRREVRPDGLTLLFEDVPGVRSAAIGVWLKLGSRHEPPRLSGICHFIEHLVFKGTETRTAQQISLLADRIGGNLDAFTSKEMTCFYARCLDEHLPVATDLVADIVRAPRFDAEELERERGVILEEIRMVNDAPEDRVYDLLAESIWPGHALGRPIQGTEQTVSSISRDAVLRWFRRAYVPPNLVVAVAGRIGAANRRRIRRAFDGLRGGGEARRRGAPRFRPALVTEHRREIDQVHLMLGLPALPAGDPERYAQHLLNVILGGSLSSRLFRRIREERGLVYSVSSSVQGYDGAGLLTVYAGTSPGKVREVVAITLEEMHDLAARGPTREEWEVARDHLKGNYMLALESTSNRMNRLAREQIVLGRQLAPEEILAELDRATPERVHALARRLFTRRRVALAAVGRTRGLRLRERDLEL